MTDLSFKREPEPKAEDSVGVIIMALLPFALAFIFLLEWSL